MITKYDPAIDPDPTEWLACDEEDRLEMIVRYHLNSDDQLPESGWVSHAALHALVENQLAEGERHVRQCFFRLIREGLSRHDAVHAVASIAAEEMYHMFKDSHEFDKHRFHQRLGKLKAKKWLEGDY